jgi:uncharacterized phosphosugar-binding protein
MSAQAYYEKVRAVLDEIHRTQAEKLAQAGEAMAAVFVAMSLVAETGACLAARGIRPVTFVSPNVEGMEPNHNQKVFEAFAARFFSRA